MILKPPENTKPRVQDPGINTGLYMKRVTEEPESRGELLYKLLYQYVWQLLVLHFILCWKDLLSRSSKGAQSHILDPDLTDTLISVSWILLSLCLSASDNFILWLNKLCLVIEIHIIYMTNIFVCFH